MELRFSNISVFENKERILSNVSGTIKTWTISCVVGHDVLTKTALLSTIAGRSFLCEGQITTNGTAVTQEQLRHNVEYVTSQDRFLPTLTVRETLTYAGLLRLPTEQTTKEKYDVIDDVEKHAELTEVADTPVQFIQPLQRKCLQIASGLLNRKCLLAIVEPFDGLKFRESRSLMSTIRGMCHNLKLGILLTTSSPTGHVMKSCDSLLWLHQGQVVYTGCPEQLANRLSVAGLQCPALLNPAEYMMTILEDNACDYSENVKALISRAKQEQENDSCHFTIGTPTNGHVIRETALIGDDIEHQVEQTTLLGNTNHVTDQQQHLRASFWFQTWLLTKRNFLNARRRILFPVSLLQNLYILVVCVLVWWRPHRGEETVKDRMGLFFFTTVQWAFFALLDAVLTFPKEMMVILQEQRSSLYRLSAFCVAKTLSELPLIVIQPCVYMTVIYWVANLRGALQLLGSIGILVIDVIAAQSIGLLIGAALDPPWTISVMSLGLLSMMLLGGAFNTPPVWLSWGKYASYFTYGLNAFITLEFHGADPIRCAENSMVPICNTVDPETNSTVTHFPSDIVLLVQGITWSAWDYVMVLIGVTITTRLLWYCCIRRKC